MTAAWQYAPTPPDNSVVMRANADGSFESCLATRPDVVAWIAAGNTPLPPPALGSPTITFLQFMALFTSAEQAGIIASADTQTKLFVIMAAGSGGIQLTNVEVVAGVNYLATTGLITSDRVAVILAGTPPS